jgi:hypothetical protein
VWEWKVTPVAAAKMTPYWQHLAGMTTHHIVFWMLPTMSYTALLMTVIPLQTWLISLAFSEDGELLIPSEGSCAHVLPVQVHGTVAPFCSSATCSWLVVPAGVLLGSG